MKIPDNKIKRGIGSINGKGIEKNFFVNLTSNSKVLHITGCKRCEYSNNAYEYLEFDTVEEAINEMKKYNKDICRCEKCFD